MTGLCISPFMMHNTRGIAFRRIILISVWLKPQNWGQSLLNHVPTCVWSMASQSEAHIQFMWPRLVCCLHYKKYSVCFKFLVTLLSFWKAWLAKTSLAGMEYGRVAQILSGYIFLKIVEKTLPNLVHLFTYKFFNINRLGNREIYLINLHG